MASMLFILDHSIVLCSDLFKSSPMMRVALHRFIIGRYKEGTRGKMENKEIKKFDSGL